MYQMARQTVKKHAEHIIRLYEQQVNKKATSKEMVLVHGMYVDRWLSGCLPVYGIACAPECIALRPRSCRVYAAVPVLLFEFILLLPRY